ncbi:nucleotidyltransferase domain-containing protein [Yinghuangia soli]|uniref:Nucleotidyltransferase domain-containing protein n=1 Tax=Yinghuangia soli TaxID=2908204 RepID=A0AA41Q3A2_9ACTN|nr:nucleotidyltransferase domain-containing protein [Yinghuangia soli]MCF2530749.1 nucleotidyltransferase domain-containing protein [Yinghuangia soli]
MTTTASTSIDPATRSLLDAFLAGIRRELPVAALWAHGSLAGGDYRPGVSDLDLIAVLDRPCTAADEAGIAGVHEHLAAATPLAAKLHCSYLATTEAADPARAHLTWAHEELMHRPVTPVTRRELHSFGLVLHGTPPDALVPAVSRKELAAFVTADLTGFWRPALDHPERWLRDVWVDLGLLTLARASATLRDDTLITKAEALDVLTRLDAPADVVRDIRTRRYADAASEQPQAPTPEWLTRRAELTRAFLGPAIDALTTPASDHTTHRQAQAHGQDQDQAQGQDGDQDDGHRTEEDTNR